MAGRMGNRRVVTAADAAAQGVRVSAMARTVVRAVTHLDVDDEGIERAAAVLADVLRHHRDRASEPAGGVLA